MSGPVFWILWILGAVAYDSLRTGSLPVDPSLGVPSIALGILLLMGLPPILTAGQMLRGKLTCVLLTIVVMALPSWPALIFSCLGMIVALCQHPANWFLAGFGGISAVAFAAVLWVTIKLEDIATMARHPALTEELKGQVEGTHGTPPERPFASEHVPP